MSLGSSFPPAFVEAQIRRQLAPGAVVKLRRVMDDGVLQEKRFVVLHVDDRTITCVINSQVGAFLNARPALLRCQVAMSAAAHDFMSHDSQVDCSRARTYRTSDVVRELVAQPGWVLGTITTELRDAMVAALKFSPTLSAAEVATLCASLAQLG